MHIRLKHLKSFAKFWRCPCTGETQAQDGHDNSLHEQIMVMIELTQSPMNLYELIFTVHSNTSSPLRKLSIYIVASRTPTLLVHYICPDMPHLGISLPLIFSILFIQGFFMFSIWSFDVSLAYHFN